MSFLGNVWSFLTTTVKEIVDWPRRHPIEVVAVSLASIGIGVVVSPVAAGLAVGATLVAGGTYLGVTKNVAEKQGIEANRHNMALRRELTDSLVQQQEANITNNQLRDVIVENNATITNQVKKIDALQTEKIQKPIVESDVHATLNISVKVSEQSIFSRPEVRKRTRASNELNDSSHVEYKI